MRLLHCIRSLNPAGGGPIEALRQRLAALDKLSVKSEVACLDHPASVWLEGFPAKVHPLGRGTSNYGYSAFWGDWIRSNHGRFDAAIINGLWQYQGLGTMQALPAGFPYFVFPHGMLDPWFKRTYPLKHLKKWLYWPWADYRLLKNARAVLFTSEEERLLARESFWLYRCNERVVNYGTAGPTGDLSGHRESFLAEFPYLRGKRMLLYLGRIHEKKGVDLLFQAWAEARKTLNSIDVELVVAGPGENRYVAEIKQLVERTGASGSVHFVGMLSGALKWGALATAEAFILPSHQENFGVAVAEALACGTPVLISRRVNIWREIVQDGAGCAEADDLPGTTALIRQWLQEPADRWQQRGVAARSCFEKRFTIVRSAESLLRVIDETRRSADVRAG